MTFSVMVHPASGQFEATLVGEPEVCATAPTREEALAALETMIAKRMENGQPQELVDFFQHLAEHRVLLPNAQEVENYLAVHSEMAPILPMICADVRQTLGPDVELSLELYKDPEIDDRYLTLYVRKEKYESDILIHLETISARFNAKLEEISGYFLLATDFSRPRGSHAV
jgi:predicted RNase H-like HicB family nuclease